MKYQYFYKDIVAIIIADLKVFFLNACVLYIGRPDHYGYFYVL